MVKQVKILFILLLLVLIVPTVFSAPSVKSVSTNLYEGVQIREPLINAVKLNTTLELHFHVFNLSNGMPFTTASTISCLYNFYDITDTPIGEGALTTEGTYDWKMVINTNNFTKEGYYSYIVWCNNSVLGGYYEGSIKANVSGYIVDDYLIIFTWILFLVIIGFTFYTLGVVVLYFDNYALMEGMGAIAVYLSWWGLLYINTQLVGLQFVDNIIYPLLIGFSITHVIMPVALIMKSWARFKKEKQEVEIDKI